MATIPPPGIWELQQSPVVVSNPPLTFLEAHKGRLLILTAIAVAGIAILVAGGVAYMFRLNTLTQNALLGSGGGLALIDLTALAVLYIRHRIPKERGIYTIVSWNVARETDFAALLSIQNKMKEKSLTFSKARQEILEEQDLDLRLTEEGKGIRAHLFQQEFQRLSSTDIICLQESYELEDEDLAAWLPGYSSFSFKTESSSDCMILWNSQKFTLLGHAQLKHDPGYIPDVDPTADTMVLLQDNKNGTKLCVTSTHLRGFDLSATDLSQQARPMVGDNQIRYNLATMKVAPQADLHICAGDYNATFKHHPKRFEILQKEGYVTDEMDTLPTHYDAHLRKRDGSPEEVKLDYIFAKASCCASVQITKIPNISWELTNLERPSDHLPVAARVVYRA